jgi:Immunoglobulin-like domain of bacterial spore germination/Sporulation and spore germination
MTDDDRFDRYVSGSDTNDSDLERRLRESLHRHAERISPRERRTEILAMAHDETKVTEPGRRWLMPVAAAASVALIGGAIAWGVANNGGSPQTSVAAPSTSAPSRGPAVPVPDPSSPNGQAPRATSQAALPVYFVGATSGTGDRFGLYREFVQADVPAGPTPAQKAKAAVAVAMNVQQPSNAEPYVQPWSGTSVRDVTVAPNLITITLSGPGAKGDLSDAQTKLAVQALVWTAQAAVGQGPIPVKFAVADGSKMLFGTYPTTKTYNRPAKDLLYQDLAPIWITSPERDQVLPAGAPVVAKGQSCAFEGNTQWQLKKGGAEIKSGFTTATSGCPTGGTWEVPLGALAAGDYTFRMYEVSTENGQGIIAETSKPFTVR